MIGPILRMYVGLFVACAALVAIFFVVAGVMIAVTQ